MEYQVDPHKVGQAQPSGVWGAKPGICNHLERPEAAVIQFSGRATGDDIPSV